MKTKFIELVMTHRVTLEVPEDYEYSVDDDQVLHQVSEDAQSKGIGEWDLHTEESISVGPFTNDEVLDATWLR